MLVVLAVCLSPCSCSSSVLFVPVVRSVRPCRPVRPCGACRAGLLLSVVTVTRKRRGGRTNKRNVVSQAHYEAKWTIAAVWEKGVDERRKEGEASGNKKEGPTRWWNMVVGFIGRTCGALSYNKKCLWAPSPRISSLHTSTSMYYQNRRQGTLSWEVAFSPNKSS